MNSLTVKLLGITFSLYGISMFLNFINVINFTEIETFYIIFFVVGLVGVNLSVGRNNRVPLILSTILFCVASLLFIVTNFDLLVATDILFPSFVFICGAVFFMLFVDNPKQLVLLLTAALLWGYMLISLMFFKEAWFFQFGNSIAFNFLSFWPILIVIFGISLLLNRKR